VSFDPVNRIELRQNFSVFLTLTLYNKFYLRVNISPLTFGYEIGQKEERKQKERETSGILRKTAAFS